VLSGKQIKLNFRFDLEAKKERYSLTNTVGDLVNVKLKVTGVRQMTGTRYSREYIWGNWGLNEKKEVDAGELEFDEPRVRIPFTPEVGWVGVYAGRDGLMNRLALEGTAKMNNEPVTIRASYDDWPGLHDFDMKAKVSGRSITVAITHRYEYPLLDVQATCYFVPESGKPHYSRKEVKEWKKGDAVTFPGVGYKEVQLFGFAKRKQKERVSGMEVEGDEQVRLLTDWTFKKSGN
jgi:hypothetical protein